MPVRCPHCGREAPDGHYCAYCGAPLHAAAPADTRGAAARRRDAYAANPREHVYHPAIISTFFPHLNPSSTHLARWVLLGAALVIFLVGLGRVVPVAYVVAALLIPALYLLYFYDAEIYEDEPLPVLGATFAAGAVLGAGMSLYFAPLILRLYRPAFQPRSEYVLLTGVGLPLLALLLMVLGPLALFLFRRRFDEVLDGLAFGVASALGFAAAQSIVYTWLLITGPVIRTGNPLSWALPTIRISILMPLLDAATAGLICAALWAWRRPAEGGEVGWLAWPPAAVLVAALGQVIPNVASDLFGGEIRDLIWYAIVLVILILFVRHVLHHSLIARAHALGHGGTLRCPHCGREAPDLPFCPHCGLALRSAAKRERRPAAPEEPANA
ncbi:MAG TPA: PrsW family glutamic-type intramembrane protease [Ktedonobacterales bacterium]|jgi:RsiW-degrading membrane proteinase PrsW (M82 family)